MQLSAKQSRFIDNIVSNEELERLDIFHHLILRWNKKINLISRQEEQYIWSKHIYDSIKLLYYIKNKNINLIDLGSGGGFPGIILSICGVKNVTLVESNNKKASFLMEASEISPNKITIYNDRVENLNLANDYDVVSSRAMAELDLLFKYSRPLINENTKLIFLKGNNVENEIQKAEKSWLFNYIIHKDLDSNENESKVIIVDKLNYKNQDK